MAVLEIGKISVGDLRTSKVKNVFRLGGERTQQTARLLQAHFLKGLMQLAGGQNDRKKKLEEPSKKSADEVIRLVASHTNSPPGAAEEPFQLEFTSKGSCLFCAT